MLLFKGTSKWCDMGSQVLSALNCDGDHPNACTSGHGMHSRGTNFLSKSTLFKLQSIYITSAIFKNLFPYTVSTLFEPQGSIFQNGFLGIQCKFGCSFTNFC